MTPEDEAFNEIEKRSKVKQDILMHPSKEAMLAAEVAVLTEMVRAQAKRIAELEKQNGVPVGVGGWLTTTSKQEQGEPVACSMCNEWEKVCDQHLRHIAKLKKKRTWVGLTDEERNEIALEVPMDAVGITEAKLKEKNT